MDLRLLEDFVSLCETRSFSRSAAARNITQSAFSRRIQSLELWLGAPLVDRSSYPTTLTVEGRAFREVAEEALRALEGARADIKAGRRASRQAVNFAALHTLALSYFPDWLKVLQRSLGPLNTHVLADNYHNCVQALVEGNSDFLLTFHHDAVSIGLDPERFPFVVLGTDRLIAASLIDAHVPLFQLPGSEGAGPPLLSYARDSFLGRLSAHAAKNAGLQLTTNHINDNAVAESLKAMVLAGHGIAWLPESIIKRELVTGVLAEIGFGLSMEIRLYRSREKTRAIVEKLWSMLLA